MQKWGHGSFGRRMDVRVGVATFLKTNLCGGYVFRICTLNFNLLALMVNETDGHGQFDSAIDTDQEYIYHIWFKTPNSSC